MRMYDEIGCFQCYIVYEVEWQMGMSKQIGCFQSYIIYEVEW